MTETKKWDVWFRKLPPAYKAMWSFLYDHCGPGGIWDCGDEEIARIFVNDPQLSLDDFLKRANEGKERIKILNHGRKWFIVDFVWVQCPTGLKRITKTGEINRVHAPIFAELEKYDIDPSPYELNKPKPSEEPLVRLQDKEQEKDGDKKETFGKRENLFNQLEAFKEFWEKYPGKGRLNESASMRLFVETIISRAIHARILKSLENYTVHLKANAWKQPMKALKWLAEWPDWENHKEPGTEKKEKKRDPHCTACDKDGNLPLRDGENIVRRCWCVK